MEDEMVRACGTCGVEKRTGDFSWKTASKELLKHKRTKMVWIIERYS